MTVPSLSPGRFAQVLTPAALTAFEHAIRRGRDLLGDNIFWNANSTAAGGGGAEMLRSLIGYACGAGLDAMWVVIEGDPDFFAITKRLHNRLHGVQDAPLGDRERSIYEGRCAANADEMAQRVRPGDVVLLHDPQTAGMIPRLAGTGVPVIWRAHVGLDLPNEAAREAWRFLIPYVEQASAWIFSRPDYAWEGLEPAKLAVIPPSIDAFSPENHAMPFTAVTAVLRAAGLAADDHHPARAVFERLDGTVGRVQRDAQMIEEQPLRLDSPLVAQVSRWDRLKDPLGMIEGFVEHVLDDDDPHLVLAGPDVLGVADDPEGGEVFAEAERAWRDLPAGARRRVHLALLAMEDPDENAVMVNALQRRAGVVVQKSLAEGFGLTVSEAMWKARSVVATNVGASATRSRMASPARSSNRGTLAPTESAYALLNDPHGAERIGEAARARVRERFLGARHLGQYVDLLARLLPDR